MSGNLFLGVMSKNCFIKAKIDDSNKPDPRCGHKMITDGISKCYIFGGFGNNGYYADLWVFQCMLILII